ncbi:MAG: lipopolysaccharide biosynthesis protein [Acidimicrobiales bacterium]
MVTGLKHNHRDSKFSVLVRWLEKPRAEIRDALEGPLIRNAASLYGSTIITSFLGFFYWFIAARMATAQAVGIASAVQSAAQFIAIVCVLGLSTFVISELAIDKTQARSLMLTAAILVGTLAAVISAGVGVVFQFFSTSISEGVVGSIGILVFVLLAVLSTTLLVLDDACIGLLRGDLQLRRNAVFAIGKLILLPLLTTVWASQSGIELVVAWTGGLIASMLLLVFELRRLTEGQSTRLDFQNIFGKRHLMFRHHWLNLSIQSPRLVFPVLVALIVGPTANAAFTATILVVGVVQMIPNLLSTVLFALAPGDEESLRREVRKTMRISLVLSIASAPCFFIFSDLILRLFGPNYVVASTAMGILGLSTYPYAMKSHYVAIARVQGNMQRAVIRTMAGACFEVGLAAAGGALHGLTGVAIGILVALSLEALVYAPTVFGVLRTAPEPEKETSDIEEGQSGVSERKQNR